MYEESESTVERRIARLGGRDNESVTKKDIPFLNSRLAAVLDLLRDGEEHPGSELDAIGGDPRRRARELRAYGFIIRVRRPNKSMECHYSYHGREDGWQEQPDPTEYYASDAWRAIAKRVAERDGFKCCECGRRTPLHCHHLDYSRFGHEELDDLITLCAYCHRASHKYRPKGANKLLRPKLANVSDEATAIKIPHTPPGYLF